MSMTLQADLEVIRDAMIVTGRYQDFRPTLGVPVRTTVGRVRFWRTEANGELVFANRLAPWGVFRLPEAEAEAGYLARLDAEAEAVVGQLAELVTRFPDRRLVLLCFDDVHRGDYCHRRWLAEWLWDRYSIEVPELPDPRGEVQ